MSQSFPPTIVISSWLWVILFCATILLVGGEEGIFNSNQCLSQSQPDLELFLPLTNLKHDNWKNDFFRSFFLFWPITTTLTKTHITTIIDNEIKDTKEMKLFENYININERNIRTKRLMETNNNNSSINNGRKHLRGGGMEGDELSSALSPMTKIRFISDYLSHPSDKGIPSDKSSPSTTMPITYYESLLGQDRTQLLYFYADLYTTSEYIGLLDSDTMFTTYISPWDLFTTDNRPIINGRTGPPTQDFDGPSTGIIQYWLNIQYTTHIILQLKEVTSCTTYMPLIIKRIHLYQMRLYIETIHNTNTTTTAYRNFTQIFDDLIMAQISDYSMPNILCTYLYHFHYHEYQWYYHFTLPNTEALMIKRNPNGNMNVDDVWDRRYNPTPSSHMDNSLNIYNCSKLSTSTSMSISSIVNDCTFTKPRIASHMKSSISSSNTILSEEETIAIKEENASKRYRQLFHGMCMSSDVLHYQPPMMLQEALIATHTVTMNQALNDSLTGMKLIEVLKAHQQRQEHTMTIHDDVEWTRYMLSSLCQQAFFTSELMNNIVFESLFVYDNLNWNTIVPPLERLQAQSIRYNYLQTCEQGQHFVNIYNIEIVKDLINKFEKLLKEGYTIFGKIDNKKSYWCKSTGRSNFVFSEGMLRRIPDWDTAVSLGLTHPEMLLDDVCKSVPKGPDLRSVNDPASA